VKGLCYNSLDRYAPQPRSTASLAGISGGVFVYFSVKMAECGLLCKRRIPAEGIALAAEAGGESSASPAEEQWSVVSALHFLQRFLRFGLFFQNFERRFQEVFHYLY
jgi:hypothetical protein